MLILNGGPLLGQEPRSRARAHGQCLVFEFEGCQLMQAFARVLRMSRWRADSKKTAFCCHRCRVPASAWCCCLVGCLGYVSKSSRRSERASEGASAALQRCMPIFLAFRSGFPENPSPLDVSFRPRLALEFSTAFGTWRHGTVPMTPSTPCETLASSGPASLPPLAQRDSPRKTLDGNPQNFVQLAPKGYRGQVTPCRSHFPRPV